MHRLALYFKGFFRPYTGAICATVLLAFCTIGTELALPQLFKIAIDRHVIASARRIVTTAEPDSSIEALAADASVMVPCPDQGCFFLLPEARARIEKRRLQQLADRGSLLQEKYYFTKNTPGKAAMLDRYKEDLFCAGAYLFISYDNLPNLSRRDLAALRADDIRGITRISLLFLLVLFCSFLFNFCQIYLVEYASQRIMHDLRMTVFEHIQGRSHAFFTRNPVGRLVTRATNDIQNLHEMFSAVFANSIKDLFIIAGIMAILFFINWKLCLVCFCILPLLICSAAVFSVMSRKAFREVRIKIAAINARIQENITGIDVVKAFCRERRNQRQFRQLNHENYRANMRQTLIFAVFNPLVDLLRLTSIALIIWYGGGQALRETITIGTVVVFLYYMRMFFRPIQDLAEKYNIIQSAVASLERVYLLLTDASVLHGPVQPMPPRTSRGRIEFRNVCFGYTDQEQVLSDVSFTVHPGETVAVVGPTGAGKTTIIRLLERFYDVQSGCILIDGIDVRDLDTSFLRRRIGLVMQDVFLFSGSIRFNVTLGSDEYSEKNIESALRIANADRFVRKLAKGLNEDIREGGKMLSSGERQLLSFARAVLRDPEILVLDEATSNIDPITEGLIQDALAKMFAERTSLVIAHRFSTIQKADRIIVLQKGRIQEQGNHEQLMQRRGLYYRLSRLQYMA